MLETSARLLRLLTLLQSRPQWPGSELAARLEVTPRTLRRDIGRLRDLDYPVHSLPGVAGGYRLGPGAALPPLQLDDDEAVAVVLSLRSSASHMLTGLAEASLSALAKLDQVLPARLAQRLSALQHATVALDSPAPVIDPALLTMLAAASRAHQRVRLRYADRGGAESQRYLEPYRLVSGGYRWYLMAFDIDRADWRTFRVDRISEPETAGGPVRPARGPRPGQLRRHGGDNRAVPVPGRGPGACARRGADRPGLAHLRAADPGRRGPLPAARAARTHSTRWPFTCSRWARSSP